MIYEKVTELDYQTVSTSRYPYGKNKGKRRHEIRGPYADRSLYRTSGTLSAEVHANFLNEQPSMNK